jgi:superfamily II DNA helicase RecQ
MESSNVHSIFNLKIKNKFGFEFNLKEEQAKIISAILNGSNVVGNFPTGFGKSMCLYLIPLLFDEIGDKNNICLIISPLKSLMMDQISKVTEIGIPAAGVMCREEMDDKTIRGLPYLMLFF